MFTYEQVFAADPANPSNIAQNAAVTIFAPGDVTMTPLTITDPDGQPLANPILVNANGFGSAFAHATLDRVAWAGGGFTGFFTSYEGMKNEAVAARTAAEAAATNASGAVTASLAAAVSDADAAAAAAAAAAATTVTTATINGSGRLILTKADTTTVDAGPAIGPQGPTGPTGPTGSQGPAGVADDASIAAQVNDTGSATRGALNATILDNIESEATNPTGILPTTYARINQLDIRAYGAVGDAKALTDATMSAGSAVLTSATANFTSADVGKTIYVMCGSSLLLKTSILSFQSATQVTLTAAATNASWILGGPNVNAIYGTPNAAALENALADAQAAALPAVSTSRYAVRKRVLVPAGNFLIERAITPLLTSGVELAGLGQAVSRLWYNEPGAMLSMGAFTATPSDAYVGGASDFRVKDLVIASPIYAPLSFENARIGTGIQDNGSGGARISDVLFSGLKYGFCGAYGSDFSRITENVTFASCDVGSYFGAGSQQVLITGTDYYRCREGAVFEGAPQWYMDGCSFEDPIVAAITLEAKSTGNTRAGVPASVAGAAYAGSQVVHGTWFESNAGESGRLAPRMVWINGDAPGAGPVGGIMIRDSYLIAGGAQVGGAHNSFIEMNSTTFNVNFIDNLVIRGNFINHIARYSGSYSTCNWNITRTLPPSGANYSFGASGSMITENGSGTFTGAFSYQQPTAGVHTMQLMQYSSGGGIGELLRTRASGNSTALSGIASGGALFGAAAAQTLASAGAVTIDASTANIALVTLQANATSSSITNVHKGQRLTISWIQDATGGRTYVWPTNCKFAGGAAPSDTTASKGTSVTFVNDGTNWIETGRAVAVG